MDPLKQATAAALQDLKDWRKWAKCVSPMEAALSLESVVKDAVKRGHRAALKEQSHGYRMVNTNTRVSPGPTRDK
jgi:hypothetical protein